MTKTVLHNPTALRIYVNIANTYTPGINLYELYHYTSRFWALTPEDEAQIFDALLDGRKVIVSPVANQRTVGNYELQWAVKEPHRGWHNRVENGGSASGPKFGFTFVMKEPEHTVPSKTGISMRGKGVKWNQYLIEEGVDFIIQM